MSRSDSREELDLAGAETETDSELAKLDTLALLSRRFARRAARRGRFDDLFSHLESTDFLAEQADFLNGFTRTAEDLETYALPGAIERADWRRFLRFAVVTANLRGVAVDLADPEMAVALARGGRFDLALDAAGRIAEPWARAQARSALAREAPNQGKGEEYRPLLDAATSDFDTAASEPAEAAVALATLAAFARDHGQVPDLSW